MKLLRNPMLAARLASEAVLGFGLAHPNLMQVHDAGYSKGRPFFVMELLRGVALDKWLVQPGATRHQTPPFAAGAAVDGTAWKVRVAIYVARGLSALHKRGYIHRDVKPSNIVLYSDPRGVPMEPKLLDFGIAKALTREVEGATQHGMMIGSPDYCPPEQRKGELGRVGVRSDIWALASVLFHLIEGHPVREAIERETQDLDPKARRSCDPALWRVLAKALSNELDDRFASVEEFGQALEPFSGGLSFDLGLPMAPVPPAVPRADEDEPTFEQLATPPPSPEGGYSRRLVIFIALGTVLLTAGVCVLVLGPPRGASPTRSAVAGPDEARVVRPTLPLPAPSPFAAPPPSQHIAAGPTGPAPTTLQPRRPPKSASSSKQPQPITGPAVAADSKDANASGAIAGPTAAALSAPDPASAASSQPPLGKPRAHP